MRHPDQLKKPARTRVPDPDDLEELLGEDLLWDALDWDPDREDAADSGRDPVEAARGLLGSGQPAEPVLAYRAIRLLARLSALGREAPALPAWPSVAPPGPGRLSDPLRLSGPAAGSATSRAWGVQEALKSPQGVRLLCITGPAGIGKTRLATDIAVESQRILRARQDGPITDGEPLAGPQEAVPLLAICLRSSQLGAGGRGLAMTAYDALADLLLALGVAEREIPSTMTERQARYAAELGGRRPVILIDDALDESQVLPLLPPGAGVVVVTSRRSLPGLSACGAVHAPVAALDASGTGTLVHDCFGALGAQADAAAAAGIHELCEGAPLPVILVSRWIAVAIRSSHGSETVLRAARGDWQRDHGEFRTPFSLPGFPAVAAMLGLLGEDQRAALQMLGLLRLPEADLWAVCIATGLSRDRARAALAQLTEIGLLANTESGAAWAMPPAVADYVGTWAWAAHERAAEAYQEALGPLLGLYERRVQALCDAAAALRQQLGEGTEQAGESATTQWVAAGIPAGREVLAALLEAAAATADPAQGRRLASAYLAAISGLDGQESGWRETERFVAPVLEVACAAGDIRLRARTLERLSLNAARQGRAAAAAALLATKGRAGDAHGAGQGPAPPSRPEQESGEPGGDSLAPIDPVTEGAAVPSQPVLFGARP
jgi:hypothetical protein